jgi:protein SCO1/2
MNIQERFQTTRINARGSRLCLSGETKRLFRRRRSKMMRIALALFMLVTFIGPCRSSFTQQQLASVSFQPAAGARMPDNAIFDEAGGRSVDVVEALAGRPALVLPVDFTCRSICGPALTMASSALAETGLRPGADFKLVVIGFDPRDNIDQARAFVSERVDPAIAPAMLILQGDAENTGRVMAAVGFRSLYDAETDQYAHPAAALVMTADGRIARALSSLALNARDLRLGLVEAGEGRIGSLADRVTLLCSQFDPIHGMYTGTITRILEIACGITVLALGGALLRLSQRPRQKRTV